LVFPLPCMQSPCLAQHAWSIFTMSFTLSLGTIHLTHHQLDVASSFRAYRHGRRIRHQKCIQVACERERTERMCFVYLSFLQLGHIFNPTDISNSSFTSICSKLFEWTLSFVPYYTDRPIIRCPNFKDHCTWKNFNHNRKQIAVKHSYYIVLDCEWLSCLWLLKFLTCSDFYLRNFSIAFLPSIHPSFLPHPFFGMTLTN